MYPILTNSNDHKKLEFLQHRFIQTFDALPIVNGKFSSALPLQLSFCLAVAAVAGQ